MSCLAFGFGAVLRKVGGWYQGCYDLRLSEADEQQPTPQVPAPAVLMPLGWCESLFFLLRGNAGVCARVDGVLREEGGK
eukprot:2439967-Rhodomonas_salina.2